MQIGGGKLSPGTMPQVDDVHDSIVDLDVVDDAVNVRLPPVEQLPIVVAFSGDGSAGRIGLQTEDRAIKPLEPTKGCLAITGVDFLVNVFQVAERAAQHSNLEFHVHAGTHRELLAPADAALAAGLPFLDGFLRSRPLLRRCQVAVDKNRRLEQRLRLCLSQLKSLAAYFSSVASSPARNYAGRWSVTVCLW